jgi:hypothetical protein
MIELNAIYGGPAVHKTEKFNPTEVLIRLIDENPSARRDAIEKLFIAEIEDDRDYRTPALKYFFWNAWAGLHPARHKSRVKTRQQQTEMRQAIDEKIQQIKRAVIISELIMPNDKTVAQCTGLEMTKFGKFGTKVGKIAGRHKVGATLSEEQLWKLWQESK